MHSSETAPTPSKTGPALLLQLGQLIIRTRSIGPAICATSTPHDRLLHAKLLAAKPSTSQQVQIQPKPETKQLKLCIEAQLSDHVQGLWNEQIPVCIEVLLAPDCPECYSYICRLEEESSYDNQHVLQRTLLLERWTMTALVNKTHDTPAYITSQWLLNAVRSQLHFSQLSAWQARLIGTLKASEEDPSERRRKLSRETCNYKKLEANCDEQDLTPNEDPQRKLNIVYSIKIPGEGYKMAEFIRTPTDHVFPITDIGNNVFLKVALESLPRIDEIPTVKCNCQPKRKASKDISANIHEELAGKLHDLTLGTRCPKFEMGINANVGTSTRRLSIISNPDSTEYLYTSTSGHEMDNKVLLDDRMLTPCSENGKHKCNYDDESDSNHRSSTSLRQEPKKLDERRLKEIAKYKRRLRKESKLKKLCDSTSSEGDGPQKVKETTSIPILQAARFDRLKAIGCYRNQTYLTLPASRIESKSPFFDSNNIPPAEFKRTNSVSTQTDDLSCPCGTTLYLKCAYCRLIRSEANYNLISLNRSEVEAKRTQEKENGNPLKKHKCDNFVNMQCDNSKLVNDSFSVNNKEANLMKRPKLRRLFPIVDRIDSIVHDRYGQNNDMEELHLNIDDSVFSRPKSERKRQKTFSINEEFVFYEKCDYGGIEKFDLESPQESPDNVGFIFPDPKKIGADNQVPSPTEMDRFRWRFDSAASMVFHTKTGLPLTSSPAPLRRGNNCFDFDDSINGISGIKSALFHPISPPSPSPTLTSPSFLPVPSPSVPSPAPAPTPNSLKKDPKTPKLRLRPSTGLLGSFEESALKGRLEPVATVHGFTAELGASGAFCPPHKRLPVTVFFYAPGGTNAPYMGHINLGPGGYRVSRSGTIQVSLFNPHGTLVKMFVVLYDLTCMPPMAQTFLRQRTLYMPVGADLPPQNHIHKWLRYLIHLRFMTSKSGKLYLHTDIRIIVSRKADLDTATAHSVLFRQKAYTKGQKLMKRANQLEEETGKSPVDKKAANHAPNRVFGGYSEFDSEFKNLEIGYDIQKGVSYELRSFTYAPENPQFSPR